MAPNRRESWHAANFRHGQAGYDSVVIITQDPALSDWDVWRQGDSWGQLPRYPFREGYLWHNTLTEMMVGIVIGIEWEVSIVAPIFLTPLISTPMKAFKGMLMGGSPSR